MILTEEQLDELYNDDSGEYYKCDKGFSQL